MNTTLSSRLSALAPEMFRNTAETSFRTQPNRPQRELLEQDRVQSRAPAALPQHAALPHPHTALDAPAHISSRDLARAQVLRAEIVDLEREFTALMAQRTPWAARPYPGAEPHELLSNHEVVLSGTINRFRAIKTKLERLHQHDLFYFFSCRLIKCCKIWDQDMAERLRHPQDLGRLSSSDSTMGARISIIVATPHHRSGAPWAVPLMPWLELLTEVRSSDLYSHVSASHLHTYYSDLAKKYEHLTEDLQKRTTGWRLTGQCLDLLFEEIDLFEQEAQRALDAQVNQNFHSGMGSQTGQHGQNALHGQHATQNSFENSHGRSHQEVAREDSLREARETGEAMAAPMAAAHQAQREYNQQQAMVGIAQNAAQFTRSLHGAETKQRQIF